MRAIRDRSWRQPILHMQPELLAGVTCIVALRFDSSNSMARREYTRGTAQGLTIADYILVMLTGARSYFTISRQRLPITIRDCPAQLQMVAERMAALREASPAHGS